MSDGPKLEEGEEMIHHHVPNLGAFKRTALLVLAITLVPTGVMLIAFPDTLWGAVPLFIACVLLMQERVTLGKYAAWLTNRRIILQSGEETMLADVGQIDTIGNAVRLRTETNGPPCKLYYPENKAALADVVRAARAALPSQEAA